MNNFVKNRGVVPFAFTFQSNVPTIEMMGHGRISVAGIKFQIDLSIDQRFIVSVIVAERRIQNDISMIEPWKNSLSNKVFLNWCCCLCHLLNFV